MEISNFRTLQQGKYTDCSATLFNARTMNVWLLLWNITNILHDNNTIISPEFAFHVQQEKKSGRIVLYQPTQGLLFEMSKMIQPSDDVMNKYMEVIRFMSSIPKSNASYLVVSLNRILLSCTIFKEFI